MKDRSQTCKTRAVASLALILWSSAALPAAGPWQEEASIRAAAEQATRRRFEDSGATLIVAAAPLDPRLRVPACEQPLVAELPASTRETARVTAAVSCRGLRPWRLFVPVRMTARRELVIAAIPLERGKVLAAGDVILTERDAGASPGGYLTTVEAAVGQVLRRSVPAGTVLAPGLLESPVLVRRGQSVTLEAGSGPIRVHMAGIAKSDGALGELVEVENTSSKRVVQGVVRNEKSVEIRLP